MASQQRCLLDSDYYPQASPSNPLFSNSTQWSPRQPDFSYLDCIYGYADLANSRSDHSSSYQQQSHCEGAAPDTSSVLSYSAISLADRCHPSSSNHPSAIHLANRRHSGSIDSGTLLEAPYSIGPESSFYSDACLTNTHSPALKKAAVAPKSLSHLTASKATHVAETSTCLTANSQSKAPQLPIKALFSFGDPISMSADQARFADALLESIRLGQYSPGHSAQLERILERYECSINHSSFFPQSDNDFHLRATLDASKELHIWCPNNSTSAAVNPSSDNLQCRRHDDGLMFQSAANLECRYRSMSQNTASFQWPQSASQ